ncbi:ets-domain-containing protein [Ditylenchus destructor]|nr:ets-domain-containing protein [Ditylenchus destructor]
MMNMPEISNPLACEWTSPMIHSETAQHSSRGGTDSLCDFLDSSEIKLESPLSYGLTSMEETNLNLDFGMFPGKSDYYGTANLSKDIKLERSEVSSESKSEEMNDSRNINAAQTTANLLSSDAAQVDIYRDLILRHLIQDISSTCNKLNLPTDPNLWSRVDCVKWIEEMCLQFQLPTPQNFPQLQGGGPTLLAMTVEDFYRCIPEGGDTLHAQLQLWKTAFESCNSAKTTSSQTVQLQTDSFPDRMHQMNYMNAHSHLFQTGNNSALANSNESWMTPDSSANIFNTSFGSSSATSMSSYYSDMADIGNSSFLKQQTMITGHNAGSSRNASTCSSMNSQSSNSLHVLPSPSESVISSSNSSCISAQDLADDEYCNDLQFFSPQMSMFNGNYASSHMPSQSGINSIQMTSANASHDQIVTGKAQGKTVNGPYARGACGSGNSGTVHLWHFIRELLDQPKLYSSCVRWVDRQEGLFKIESSHHLAKQWGLRKNRTQMNYDKLSRSLRQYYKKGIIQKPEKKQRLVYKFLPPYNM